MGQRVKRDADGRKYYDIADGGRTYLDGGRRAEVEAPPKAEIDYSGALKAGAADVASGLLTGAQWVAGIDGPAGGVPFMDRGQEWLKQYTDFEADTPEEEWTRVGGSAGLGLLLPGGGTLKAGKMLMQGGLKVGPRAISHPLSTIGGEAGAKLGGDTAESLGVDSKAGQIAATVGGALAGSVTAGSTIAGIGRRSEIAANKRLAESTGLSDAMSAEPGIDAAGKLHPDAVFGAADDVDILMPGSGVTEESIQQALNAGDPVQAARMRANMNATREADAVVRESAERQARNIDPATGQGLEPPPASVIEARTSSGASAPLVDATRTAAKDPITGAAMGPARHQANERASDALEKLGADAGAGGPATTGERAIRRKIDIAGAEFGKSETFRNLPPVEGTDLLNRIRLKMQQMSPLDRIELPNVKPIIDALEELSGVSAAGHQRKGRISMRDLHEASSKLKRIQRNASGDNAGEKRHMIGEIIDVLEGQIDHSIAMSGNGRLRSARAVYKELMQTWLPGAKPKFGKGDRLKRARFAAAQVVQAESADAMKKALLSPRAGASASDTIVELKKLAEGDPQLWGEIKEALVSSWTKDIITSGSSASATKLLRKLERGGSSAGIVAEGVLGVDGTKALIGGLQDKIAATFIRDATGGAAYSTGSNLSRVGDAAAAVAELANPGMSSRVFTTVANLAKKLKGAKGAKSKALRQRIVLQALSNVEVFDALRRIPRHEIEKHFGRDVADYIGASATRSGMAAGRPEIIIGENVE